MSKSLDNFFLVRDMINDFSAPVLRFYLLNANYRSPIDFSDSNLEESRTAYNRLEGTYTRFKRTESNGSDKPEELEEAIATCRKDFVSAMNDDFNTREALASLFQLSRVANNHSESSLASDLKEELVKTFDYYGNQVLGLFPENSVDEATQTVIEKLVAKRDSAREAKDWAESDSIRDELIQMGVEVQDTPEGTKWRRI